MNTQSAATAPPSDLDAFINAWLQAVQTKDADAIMAFYAEDVIAFDAVEALQFKGKTIYGKHWRKCMDFCPGPMVFELHQTHTTTNGDLGVCYALVRCGGVDDDGQEKASFMRMTTVYRQHAGQWRIVHEHYSAPFDMQTSQAIFTAQIE